jgi:hypothetical protein
MHKRARLPFGFASRTGVDEADNYVPLEHHAIHPSGCECPRELEGSPIYRD